MAGRGGRMCPRLAPQQYIEVACYIPSAVLCYVQYLAWVLLWLEFRAYGGGGMCPRLAPQQYFEVACCSGKVIVAVPRVSCIWRGLRGVRRKAWRLCLGRAPCTCCAEIVRILDDNRVFAIRRSEAPVETRARGFKNY